MIEFILFIAVVILFFKLGGLSSRIDKLEKGGVVAQKTVEKSPEESTTSDSFLSPTGEMTAAKAVDARMLAVKVISTPLQDQETQPEKAPKQEARQGLTEEQIGKEWFNKIGAVSIIIGLILFVGYSFEYFGPLGKIVIGYISSFLVLGIGLFLNKKYKNYSVALLAVGWAGAYFTTYATYHVEASQIFFSINTNILLLFIVSASLAVFSYLYSSEKFSILAIALGMVSVIFSPAPFISVIAILILAAYAAGIAMVKNWAALGLAGVIGSYLTYFVAFYRQGWWNSYEQFQLGSFFLIIYFLLFAAVSLFIRSGKYEEKQYHYTLITMNTLAFYVVFIFQLLEFAPEKDGLMTALLGVALLIFAVGAYFFSEGRKYLYITYAWLGWGFLTLAVPMQLVGGWVAGAWLAEGAALFIIGLVNNRRGLLNSGTITLALFLMKFLLFDLLKTELITIGELEIATRVVLLLFSMFIFLVIYFVWEVQKSKIEDKEIAQLVFAPLGIAVILLMILTYLEGAKDYLGILFLIQGAFIYSMGILVNRDYVRIVGLLPLLVFGSFWGMQDLHNTSLVAENSLQELNFRTLSSMMGAVILYILYIISEVKDSIRPDTASPLSESEKSIKEAFAVAASAIVVIFTFVQVNPRLITLIWAVEGTTILIAGFLFNKRTLRLVGIVVMLMTILRIFIIDLSFLETIYRIVSFIVLGVILMGISFIYTKYKDKIL